MNIQQLAAILGQSEKDVIAFVECLRVWTDKGYSIEDAVSKHMDQMNRLVSNAAELPKSIAADAFFA